MAWTYDMAKSQEERVMFRELSDEEEESFRDWARKNRGWNQNQLFHPVVNDELAKLGR